MSPTPREPRRADGILSDPIDLDGPRRPRVAYPEIEAEAGLIVKQRGTPLTGSVVECGHDRVLIRDRHGREHLIRLAKGAFVVDGANVTLVKPRPAASSSGSPQRTASGSLAAPGVAAQVARASRLLVEGRHDAELIERVWGDDLRAEGVVVEMLDGADHLEEAVRGFGPRAGRRLGVLLDHLVDGSKEARIAASIDHPDVLVLGHPYVDIWQAIRPQVIGLDSWPEVPRSLPWKEGLIAALGRTDEPADFWRMLLARLNDWTQLETPLIGAVEQLIDFVTAPS